MTPTPPPRRRFISLKWRLALVMSIGLIGISLIFFWFNYSNLKDYADKQRAALDAREDQEFEALMMRDSTDLQRLGEFIPALPGIRGAMAAGDGLALQAAFDAFWPTLEMDIEVEAVRFFDAAGAVLASFESPFLGGALPPMDRATLQRVADQEQPLSTVICAASCAHYALIPVLSKGRRVGAIMLASAFGKLLRSFSQVSGNHLGLLLRQPGLERKYHLPNWDRYVTALTGDDLPLLQDLAQHHPRFPADRKSLKLDDRRGTFEVRLLPIHDAHHKLVAHLVSIRDISARRQAIANARQAGWVLLAALLIFAELGLFLVLHRPMTRLRQTARSLPLLAERRYQDLRQAIAGRRRGRSEDEIDILNHSALTLSAALEDLEAQVQTRNRELADKVSELAQERERYALAARAANDGLWDWDLNDDEVYYSPRWKQMSGYRDDQVGSAPDDWFNRVHPDDIAPLCNAIDAHLAGTSDHIECEYRLLQANQSYRWMLTRAIAVSDDHGHPYRIAGSQNDIHERKQAQEQLQHDALHDALTRLPNRLLFMDRLKQTLRNAERRDNISFAVLYVDLDRFKIINDSLGHAAGDQLLIAVAQRFKRVIRPMDTVARMGGDEFALIIEELDDRNLLYEILQRLQDQISLPVPIDGRDVFTSLSTGIAFYRPSYRNADEILRDADTAMYHAKKSGANRYAEFDTGMHAHVLTLMKVQEELKKALVNDELTLCYQPIINLGPEQSHNPLQVVGFEALVRWNHPERGLLPPAEFLPVAEETELMGRLGDWVLEAVCRQVAAWRRQLQGRRQFSVNINLDANHLMHAEFPEQLAATLERHQLAADWIRIEITENMFLDNSERAVDVLSRVKKLGVKVCLDDFGTGYSSLSYLRRLPIDTLKIDRSFITNLDGPERDLSIVRAIITLAHSLNMEVVAEGIETVEQQRALQDLDCDFGQGFLYAHGLMVERVLDFSLAEQDSSDQTGL